VPVRYAIVGTEGPHDQAFVSAAMKLLGLKEFSGTEAELDPFWKPFIPIYPKSGGRLYQRLDMPSIVFNDDVSAAIYAGEGSKLKSQLPLILENNSPYRLETCAFGIVADADEKGPNSVAQEYSQSFRDLFPVFPTTPGVVNPETTRTGIFVLPDNEREGVLDSLIVECRHVVYPVHMTRSVEFVEGFEEKDRSHWKPFDHDKAVVASSASILRPGMTNTVTIKQDGWLAEDSKSVPGVARFLAFARDLLELP